MRLRLLFKIVSTSLVAVLSKSAFAQTPQRFLRIEANYDKVEQRVEEAVDYIEAINMVGSDVNVEYKAGQAVTLLPGFVAVAGSTFSARVESTNYLSDNVLRVTAFPNPFVQTTTIEYYLPKDGKVSLWILDEQGKQVRQLVVEQEQAAGTHSFEWKTESTSSGIYIPVVSSNQKQTATRLIKK